jgi:hypothetical protein
MKNTNT